MRSRPAPLPRRYGEADRLTITCAPASASVMAGGPGLPDVLADGEADRHAVQLDDAASAPRLEVALLVEDAVVRQVHLAVDAATTPPSASTAAAL